MLIPSASGVASGLRTRQVTGSWEGTLAEIVYLRDPLFRRADRLFLRGRVVLSPQVGEGKGLGAYIEGSINTSPGHGRDEAR